MHVHTLLMAQLRQLKSKDSLLHLAFSGIRNPCFLLLHVCGNCFRFSSGRCFPEQIKSLLSGCRLCCLRSLQNICILCSQTFIILSNYKHTFFTKGNKPFHITKFFFFINADIRETGYRLSSFSGVISDIPEVLAGLERHDLPSF